MIACRDSWSVAIVFLLLIPLFFSDTAIVVNRPDMGDFGTMFKIVPYTTQKFVNKITCFKVPGSKDAKVTAQGVLPDVTLYNVSHCSNTILLLQCDTQYYANC